MPGYTTYRLYAEFASTSIGVVEITGIPDTDGSTCLSTFINSETGFFNHTWGGSLATSINPLFYPFVSDLAADSWLTIGLTDVNSQGIVQQIGSQVGLSFHNNPGSDFHLTNGSIFTLMFQPNVLPTGPDNRVLLGQFTTQGCIEYGLTLTLVNPSNQETMIYTYDDSCIPEGLVTNIPVFNGEALGMVSVTSEVNCLDPDACNYGEPSCVCNYITCAGCLDPMACNYDLDATIEMNSACLYQGCYHCDDPEACNYNPEPNQIDYCCYDCGCSDPNAANFVDNPICAVQSCSFPISGLVFHDANNNGALDSGETGLQGITVTVGEYSAITDSNGEFTLLLPIGSYVPSVLPSDPYLIVTTPEALFNVTDGSTLVLPPYGIATELNEFHLPSTLHSTPTTWGWFTTVNFICDQFKSFRVDVTNLGPETINGYIEVVKDPLITVVTSSESIDSVFANAAYVGFSNLAPLEQRSIYINLLSPGWSAQGNVLATTFNAVGLHDTETVNGSSNSSTAIVQCAYDPNDKQPIPVGYEEPHFILADTVIQYTIRFQNTGNFFALNVEIKDDIDAGLDLSTFEVVDASHNMQTFVNAVTREVRFFFPEIMLPDSTCCGDESIGFLTFKIRPCTNLTHGTVIHNTARIYFDSNPAIITNTTEHTIFACSNNAAVFDAPANFICQSQPVTFTNNTPWFESYTWLLNDVPIGDQNQASTEFNTTGWNSVTLILSNPLCTATHTETVFVEPAPDVFITVNDNLLTATGATTWQWYLNDEPLPEATSATLLATATGDYRVLGTNEFGCSSFSPSEHVIVTTVANQHAHHIGVYPVPATQGTSLTLTGVDPAKITELRVFDALGKCVMSEWNGTNRIDLYGLPAGWYLLTGIQNEEFFRVNFQISR